MLKRLRLRHLLFAGALVVAFVFQNCSQPQDTSQDELAFDASLPFAYQARIDTLAYMSCSDVAAGSYDSRAYFTFRAGAYNNTTGGMTVAQNFYNQTQYYDNTSRANLLSQVEWNANTFLNFSIRQASNYQNLFYIDQVSAGSTIDAFTPELDLPQAAGPFASLKPGQYANYFPGNESKRLMEASLQFLSYETNAVQIRNNLADGDLILVAGYPETASLTDQSLKSPLDPQVAGGLTVTTGTPTNTFNTNQTQVFGTGYKLGFSLPYGHTQGENRVLSVFSGVQEVDLTTGTTIASNWDCDATFEFFVVNPQDLVPGANATNPYTSTNLCWEMVDTYSNATQQAALNAIRRVLRVEDWYVDVTHMCVIPKQGGDVCYGSDLASHIIMYNQTACANTATTLCPHMVSVCIRH